MYIKKYLKIRVEKLMKNAYQIQLKMQTNLICILKMLSLYLITLNFFMFTERIFQLYQPISSGRAAAFQEEDPNKHYSPSKKGASKIKCKKFQQEMSLEP